MMIYVFNIMTGIIASILLLATWDKSQIDPISSGCTDLNPNEPHSIDHP